MAGFMSFDPIADREPMWLALPSEDGAPLIAEIVNVFAGELGSSVRISRIFPCGERRQLEQTRLSAGSFWGRSGRRFLGDDLVEGSQHRRRMNFYDIPGNVRSGLIDKPRRRKDLFAPRRRCAVSDTAPRYDPDLPVHQTGYIILEQVQLGAPGAKVVVKELHHELGVRRGCLVAFQDRAMNPELGHSVAPARLGDAIEGKSRCQFCLRRPNAHGTFPVIVGRSSRLESSSQHHYTDR